MLASQKSGLSCLATLPSLREVNALSLFIPYHSFAWDLGQQGPGKRSGPATQRQDLGCGSGGAAVAIVCVYLSSTSGRTTTSISGFLRLVKPMLQPHLFQPQQTGPGRRLSLDTQRWLRGLGCGRGVVAVASAGNCKGSVSE